MFESVGGRVLVAWGRAAVMSSIVIIVAVAWSVGKGFRGLVGCCLGCRVIFVVVVWGEHRLSTWRYP